MDFSKNENVGDEAMLSNISSCWPWLNSPNPHAGSINLNEHLLNVRHAESLILPKTRTPTSWYSYTRIQGIINVFVSMTYTTDARSSGLLSADLFHENFAHDGENIKKKRKGMRNIEDGVRVEVGVNLGHGHCHQYLVETLASYQNVSTASGKRKISYYVTSQSLKRADVIFNEI